MYSTCSFTTAQNEDIVAWLLETSPDARIVPIDPSEVTEAAQRWSGAADVDAMVPQSAASAASSSVAPDPLFMQVHSLPRPPCVAGAIAGTLRFTPLHCGGVSGLFVCRLTKVLTVP